MIDVELLTLFTVKELDCESACITSLASNEIARVWSNCKSKRFIYENIYRSPLDSDYEWGSEELALAFEFCKYYKIFSKFKSENS